MKEVNLRMLIRIYNGQRYLPNILPSMDEVSGPDNTLFYSKGNTEKTLPEYTLNEPIVLDDIELDMDFKQNYQHWLEKDVYSSEDEDDVSKDWSIGTPIPSTQPISAEQLADEINKLYIEELNKEFKEPEEAKEVIDGWDQPIDTSRNAWGMPVEETKVDEEEDTDEVEPEFNPLQGINWDSLTEDELKKRLSVVEEKTVQRWMNVDMNDPAYIKVLNTFEGDIEQDDEGWPVW